MKWDKYTIKTITAAEDVLSAVLADLGVEGVQIEDKIPLSEEDKQKMYIDILPELPEDDGVAYVSFFIEKEISPNGENAKENHAKWIHEIMEAIEELRAFMDIGEGSIEKTTTEDIDWINNWKEFFKPFTVEDIYIKPTWEETGAIAEGKMVIEIDPGTAFGTGKHETTQLCIRQLKKYVTEGCKVMDLGCGSGILSIVAAKLGAANVLGVDVDQEAVKASWENIEVNHISQAQCQFQVGNILEDELLEKKALVESFDLVVANILADTIVLLTPAIPAYLKTGGLYISSGILYTKEQEVVDAIKATGFEIVEVTREGDWVSVTARKQG